MWSTVCGLCLYTCWPWCVHMYEEVFVCPLLFSHVPLLCILGYWRLLDFDYEMKLLGHITQLVDSESWSFSKVPLRVSLEELGRLEPQ
jgi:hypothetical protein